MVKVKGVNIYPGQVEDVLKLVGGVSSEYQVIIDQVNGKDSMMLCFETNAGADTASVEKEVMTLFKTRVGLTIVPKGSPLGSLPRSEKKSKRIIDHRY